MGSFFGGQNSDEQPLAALSEYVGRLAAGSKVLGVARRSVSASA